MASQNKKNKQKNSHAWKSILKQKKKGGRGLSFYTSAQRQVDKHEVHERV